MDSQSSGQNATHFGSEDSIEEMLPGELLEISFSYDNCEKNAPVSENTINLF